MIDRRLRELGIQLPPVAAPAGLYAPAVVAGSFLFVSGQLPVEDGGLTYRGKLGAELTIEDGRAAARLAALNALAAASAALGSLDRVERVVRLSGYVASAEGFTAQPSVVNGASELLRDVFGEERGVGARSAVGVAQLPAGAPVEIELTLLIVGD